jgi:hypothetical protein
MVLIWPIELETFLHMPTTDHGNMAWTRKQSKKVVCTAVGLCLVARFYQHGLAMQSEGWHQDDVLTISMEALAFPARHKETHVVLDGNETAALDPSKSERTHA